MIMLKPGIIVLAFSVFVASCGNKQESREQTKPVEVEIVDTTIETPNSVFESEAIESAKSEPDIADKKPYELDFINSKQTIPQNAYRYKRLLYGFAQTSFGIEAPVGLLAAQIHKESTWRVNAKSPYAEGLSQFTPDTQEFIKKKYPALSYGDALDPTWAIQAMMFYDKDLKTQVDAIDNCNDWAFTFAMYNGGPGWIWKEKNIAEAQGYDRNMWWGSVEKFNAGRRDSAIKENRDYPKKIILELQELYVSNGWQSHIVCSN